MAILREIIDDVIEKYTQYKPSDDLEVPEAFIIKKINDVRATLISQLAKQGRLDESFYQRICCLDIVCEEQGCIINGEFYGTENIIYSVVLPELITDIGINEPIRFLGSNDWKSFNIIGLDNWRTIENHPLLQNSPSATRLGNKVYIKNLITPGMRKICAVLLIMNPVDVCDYNELIDNYPVPDPYKLSLLVVKDLMSVGNKPDTQQDASDTPIDSRTLQQNQQNIQKT